MKRYVTLWRARVQAAERRGGFNATDAQDAGRWNTCAVGEVVEKASQRLRVKLVEDPGAFFYQGPVDDTLQRLGGEFAEVVRERGNLFESDFLRAYELLDLIEARAITLRYKF